jgi:geranylgeranyl pyrophosphate synthase
MKTPRPDFPEALRRTREEMRRTLTNAPTAVKKLTGHLARAEGKLIRARALLTCAMACDGTIDADAIPVAAAIELLHLATLVHDDILDSAVKRRGIEALHHKFGDKNAVLCGDYLFCIAFSLAGSIPPPKEKAKLPENVLPSYLTEICLGALRENQNLRNYRLSERAYFKIISGKTAALFEATFYAGFLLSGAEERLKDDFLALGQNIGIIFQLSDDCADFESTQKASKKPVLSDFRQGVITLPLIYALKHDPALLEKIRRGISPRELKKAVAASGGLLYTHAKIDETVLKSAELIASLAVPEEQRSRLQALLDLSAGIVPEAEAIL